VFESPAPATFDATGLAPGDYLVGVRAFLNGVYNVGSITVTVLPRNNPPVLDPIGEFGMDEGQTLEKVITASDPDGDLLAFTLDFDGIGSFCELISSLGDTALLSCSTIGSTNPGIGRYRFTVTVTDNGMPPLSDSETFIVSVTPPLLLIEPINSTLDEEFVPLDVSSTSPGVQFSWDFNNDGVFDDAFGEVVSFSLLGLVPGFYPVKVQGCVDVPNDVPVCNEAETGVNVLPADPDEPPSFDGLRSLVRDNVSSPAVKFTLLLVLNLAEFLDRAGALTAAERTLETFIRLVERFTPRFISPEAAEQMIQMADDLIDLLFD
jgi:hypothetical protein